MVDVAPIALGFWRVQVLVASASCCLAHLASPGAFARAVVSSANWQIGDASNETKVVNIPPQKKTIKIGCALYDC